MKKQVTFVYVLMVLFASLMFSSCGSEEEEVTTDEWGNTISFKGSPDCKEIGTVNTITDDGREVIMRVVEDKGGVYLRYQRGNANYTIIECPVNEQSMILQKYNWRVTNCTFDQNPRRYF